MDSDGSQGLLKSILGFFARKPPEKSTPTSLRSRALDAWVRADAYVQYNSDGFDEIDPESLKKTLRVLEDYVQSDSDRESDSGSHHATLYPKLQAMRSMIDRPSHHSHSRPGNTIRVSKRKREIDAVIEELSQLDREAKKRRALPREEPTASDNLEDPYPDVAMLTRKHLVSLNNALRAHWICVCQKCSGLSVRLSMPQQRKDLEVETCFEVFFGVRSLLATTLQEAKITVKDVHDNTRRASEPGTRSAPSFAHICQSITESLGQQNCLHLALEDGIFQRLHPQPKTFGGDQMSRTVSLSALFNRQQELRGSSSALPLKGKRILAVTLATALLPFLETPWLQPSFDHSKIRFFQPLQDGELPDITKPFLAMEHIPALSASKTDTGISPDSAKHMVHPNASVLALGILLCELHYCTPVGLMQKDSHTARNVNTDYYTSLDTLKTLEADAGVDYYLATKACLQWEYLPPGQQADFESISVQRLFYQNVIKRLEAEIFKSWRLRLEDLGSFDPRENELCWGSIGREVVRHQIAETDPSDTNNADPVVSHRSNSDTLPMRYRPLNSDMMLRMPSRPYPGSQPREHCFESLTKSLYFFDASHQTGREQDNRLSQKWMDSLLSSIHHHVDPFDLVDVGGRRSFEPVRIAILDSGFDPENPLLMTEDQRLDPRIKDARSFVHQTEPHDIRDEIGHGTHALGLLLQVATCAEIYIARIAHRETLNRNTYDDIAKAINHAVSDWKVDVISMSFGIREYSEPMKAAISNALHSQTLLFAAASNDGANLGRAFPAKYPSVFCIHSTDGNGNPSAFNPTADDKDVNFSLLGEHVSSHWPVGKNGCHQPVNTMSGTSVATPIAAGLAASVLSFVRQQEQNSVQEGESLGPWLKDVHSMDAVLKSMVRQTRGAGYDYITPHVLFDKWATREHVYDRIKDIRRHMYD